MATSTNRDSDKFMLRLPDGMRDQLKALADKNNRSMNAEIIERIKVSFSLGESHFQRLRHPPPPNKADARKVIKMIKLLLDDLEDAGFDVSSAAKPNPDSE